MPTYFRIEFNHPAYDALDCMPFGMDRRYIPTDSISDAKILFEIKYPKYAEAGIRSIEDTTCSTRQEVEKWELYGQWKLKDFEEYDRRKGYINEE